MRRNVNKDAKPIFDDALTVLTGITLPTGVIV